MTFHRTRRRGTPMKTLWPYDPYNQDTHPYIGYVVVNVTREFKIKSDEDEKDIKQVFWVKNPNFRYGHLLKGY